MLPIVRCTGKNRNATGYRNSLRFAAEPEAVGDKRSAEGAEFAAARPVKP